MTKMKLIQALTLSSFIFLIAAFLMFRTGKLNIWSTVENHELQTSPNGGPMNVSYIDTVPQKTDSVRTMASSSKSMVLLDFKIDNKTRKQIRKAEKQAKKDSVTRSKYLGSSKSGIIFGPKDMVADTSRIDSSKIRKKKQ